MSLHPKALAVQEALHAAGVDAQVRELPDSTRTAPEAAAAVGVGVAQIVKSLVFLAGDELVVALVSGANRASVPKMTTAVGAPLRQADAVTVKERTGYAIGGVAPVGQPGGTIMLVDTDLLAHEVVWAAAGTPKSVFPIAPAELVRVTGGRVLELAE
jgi:prolyl-tRNA editing enzyme YbaK/EbsC (Cys-tRNA(Pro) deacylase)